jgi:DNA polymerase-3 subunit epsilon
VDVSGVTARAPDSLLTVRALDFLAAGPADAAKLVASVCQLSGVPALVAEHLAVALFAGRSDVARDGQGRWALAPVAAPVARAVELLDTLPYVVVDVETTGSSARAGDRVTEVAAYTVHGGVVTKSFETLVNPERPIPAWVTALTNITWDMVKDAPRFGDICDELLAVLEGRVFVAHNAEFDWRFLCTEVQRATGQTLGGRRLCTVRLARRVLPQLRSRRLDSVAHYYGVEIASRHRAGGDAEATAQVLIRLLADAGDRECRCWADLEHLLAIRPRRPRRRRPPAMPRAVERDTTA